MFGLIFMRNVKTWNMKIFQSCSIRFLMKYKTTDIFILKLVKRKKFLQKETKDLSRKMFKKVFLEQIAWIALIEPMLFNLLWPGNSCLAGWVKLVSSPREETCPLSKDYQITLRKSSECNGPPTPMPWVCSTQEHQPKKLILPQQAKEPPKELFRMVTVEWKDTFWAISMTQESKIISISPWENSNQKAILQKRSITQVWTQFGCFSSW